MSAVLKVPLGDVASFIRGITFKPDDIVPVGSEGSVACMRTKNVQSELDMSDVWGVSESLVRRDDQFLGAGDLLVSSANSWNLVGKCCWVPGLPWRATFGGFISVLRCNSTKIDPSYLYYWFSSPQVQSTVRSFGQQTTNISNLNIDRCLRLQLPLPPLLKQRQIAELLDKANSLRAKRLVALAKLDTLSESIYLDMFRNATPQSAISSLLENGALLLHKDGNHGSSYPRADEFAATGVPFLTAKSISDAGGIDNTSVQMLNELRARTLKIGWIIAGDVLLAHNASVGKVALYDGRFKEALIGTSLTAFRPNPQVLDSRFLAAAMRAPHFQKQLKKDMGQTTRNQVPITAQRHLTLPVPPMEMQRTFGRRMDVVENLRITAMSSLTAMDTLFSSIVSRAFRGVL